MHRTAVVITTLVLIIAGVGVVVWSRYQGQDVGKPVVNIRSFTDENFQVEVVEASKKHPILVDFYADWCFPCKLLDPVLEEVARDMQGRAIIGKLDTEKNLIARRFGISRIPAVFIIRDGEVKDSFYGVVPKETIVKVLKQHGS